MKQTPENCIHGEMCNGIHSYIKSILPTRKFAIQKCKDVTYNFECIHYCPPLDRDINQILDHLIDEIPFLDGHGEENGAPLIAISDVMRLIDTQRRSVKEK